MKYERHSKTDPIIVTSQEPTVSSPEGGSYRVIRLLGRGTMSSVYLAEQTSMARPVALKILSPALAGDPEFVERFLREARASARLNHPNIVSAIDFGEFESRFFLAMEFVDGQPLSEMISLEEKRVVSIGSQVIAALEHANRHHVIHLDVKPANIMVCKDGWAKLTDFGLAMILDSPGVAEASRKAVGTPYYMAPEQVEGGKLDWRTDQYSLGASLYEAVTGVKPFQGNSVSDILVKRFFEKPEPAWKTGRKKVSKAFSAVLAKMLSRSPDGRYQSFKELRTDFERLAEGKRPIHAKMHLANSSSQPHASAWNSFGDDDVIDRVDHMIWQKRWSWLIYSCLLFLVLIAGYGLLHGRELVGPMPPSLVHEDRAHEAGVLPPNISDDIRGLWKSSMRLMIKAEQEPTVGNIRRAIFALRLIATNRDYADTAQARAAKNRIAFLERELIIRGAVYPGEDNTLDALGN